MSCGACMDMVLAAAMSIAVDCRRAAASSTICRTLQDCPASAPLSGYCTPLPVLLLLRGLQVLIADFFLVLAILAWLGVGLAEKATVQSSTLIDAWLPLWPLVFQPAIGVLMAGALVSGGLNWLQEKQQKQ